MTGATEEDLGCIHNGSFHNHASDCERRRREDIVRHHILEILQKKSPDVVDIVELAGETLNSPRYILLRLRELEKEEKAGIDGDYAWAIVHNGGQNHE